ncbi:hypothetical protein PYJP_10980 [Pyrofollis japonicus]|uniref:phosphatase PAP2 family protein n=1 Tax=Pyrofollis japonicus TaxID=3060460 RepID=UPI00295B4081|nr:phosphatase PAP2 family protein [Pyrofollis japonicus]BEP17746.1 hypothetical protein PYJP_10980 [Pyrofollis japonicus]
MAAKRAIEAIALGVGVVEALICLLGGVVGCKAVTAIGGEGAYMAIGLIVYVLISGVAGIRLVSGLTLGASTGVLLKTLINLPRPPSSEWLVPASGPGFPSGHALMSTLFWGIVAAETRSPLVLLGGSLSVAAVSASRLVLHVHYSRDIVGGIIVGSVLALIYFSARMRLCSLRLATVLVAASAPLAAVALLASPSYSSAQHVMGIVLGLAAGLAILYTGVGKESLVEKLGALGTLLALTWSGLGAIAAKLSSGSPISVLGFALFAFLVTTSRPIALLLVLARKEEKR